MSTSQAPETYTAFSVLFVFSSFELVLIGIIIHLIYIAKRNRSSHGAKTTNKENKKRMLIMIWITLIGIISFAISLLLIIFVVIEIITIQYYNISLLNTYYYSSFETIHIFITLFDDFGHLAMISVFVIRLKRFFKNSMFGYSKILLRSIYCCLFILASFAFGILIQIAVIQIANHSHADEDIVSIIITNHVWEILIQLMELWLLYLYISKLSQLIVMSLNEDELHGIIKLISSKNKTSTNAKAQTPPLPNPNMTRKDRVFSVESDVRREQNENAGAHHNVTHITGNNSYNTAHQLSIAHTLANPDLVTKHRDGTGNAGDNYKNEPVVNNVDDKQIIYLVSIMTKMTVLVMIAVIVSLTGLIGNILIEVNELQTIKEHTPNREQIWLLILPVMDQVITSICLLYLQFNFTNGIYSILCSKLDKLCLRIIGKILQCKIRSSTTEQETEHSMDGEDDDNDAPNA